MGLIDAWSPLFERINAHLKINCYPSLTTKEKLKLAHTFEKALDGARETGQFAELGLVIPAIISKNLKESRNVFIQNWLSLL